MDQQLLDQLNSSLQSQNLVIAPKAYVLQPISFTTDKPTGTESPSFNGELKAELVGLAFHNSDLNTLISQRISQTLSSDRTLQIDSNSQISYDLKSLDLNAQTAVITVHFAGLAVYNIDLASITPQLSGKTVDQVNDIIRSQANVEKVDITLAPAWQKRFPWFSQKISVSLGKDE